MSKTLYELHEDIADRSFLLSFLSSLTCHTSTQDI